MTILKTNPILAVDSYKLSHAKAFPKEVQGLYAYIEARTGGKDMIIPFGLQIWLKDFLSTPVTAEHIEEAEAFAKLHGEPFDPKPWQYIVDRYEGYMPVVIYAVPEGTPVPSGNAIVTISCVDPEVFWLPMYLETALQRAVWYPTTVASLDYNIKLTMARRYRISSDNLDLLPFALHDFGARGVTSSEQAMIGGAAHLVNFMGSDTIEGVRAANFYYDEKMAAFSVPASEHSIETAFGEQRELEYLEHMLDTYAKPGAIVSIVIDGYDVYRAANILCTTLKDKIVSSGAKVVFRPDSGDMLEVVPKILDLQAESFGYIINTKGYKKINNVGILQGDGVDRDSILKLLDKIMSMGYSADNVVFGSGGALLQKVNRDTYKFAQKASAVLINEKWHGISKNPVTDPGKKSKEGPVILVKSVLTGEYSTVSKDSKLDSEFIPAMHLVYKYGLLHNTTTLAEVRDRCKIE